METIFAAILDAAARAPSPHNTQPWLIKKLSKGVEIYISKSRTLPASDDLYHDSIRSIGGCLENIRLAIEHMGYEVNYKISSEINFEKPLIIIKYSENKALSPEQDLYKMIPIRRTSRLPYIKKAISPAILQDLEKICSDSCKLYITEEPKNLSKIQKIVKEATLSQLENKTIGTELYQWLRFSKKDPRWYRDGLNADCLELNKLESIISRYLLIPKILKLICKLSLHKIIFSNASKHSPQTNTICLMVTNGSSIKDLVKSGMVLQRLWLKATHHNLTIHPLSAAVDVKKTLLKVRDVFKVLPEENHVSLFRLGYSKKCHRSARLTVGEIVMSDNTTYPQFQNQ